MRLSPKGRILLTLFEGSRNRAYKDAAGLWTIGVGHLIREHERAMYMDRAISKGEINQLLSDDIYEFETGVLEACAQGGLMPTQTQFDAFVLLAFNIGMGGHTKKGEEIPGFVNSTVIRRFLNRDDAGAAAAFLMWNKITVRDRASGKKKLVASRALEARRIAESRVFLHGYYDETPYRPLDDDEKIKAMQISSNTREKPGNIIASESEARPNLKTSRTMKATVAGQAGSGLVTVATTAGVIKTVADQTKAAADSASDAVKSVTNAAEATGETASLLSNLSLWIYGLIGAGALVAIIAFILVRRARRDDWRRGLR